MSTNIQAQHHIIQALLKPRPYSQMLAPGLLLEFAQALAPNLSSPGPSLAPASPSRAPPPPAASLPPPLTGPMSSRPGALAVPETPRLPAREPPAPVKVLS